MNPSLLSSTLVYPNDFTPITIQTYGTEEVYRDTGYMIPDTRHRSKVRLVRTEWSRKALILLLVGVIPIMAAVTHRTHHRFSLRDLDPPGKTDS